MSSDKMSFDASSTSQQLTKESKEVNQATMIQSNGLNASSLPTVTQGHQVIQLIRIYTEC